jgi:hypothetical protein
MLALTSAGCCSPRRVPNVIEITNLPFWVQKDSNNLPDRQGAARILLSGGRRLTIEVRSHEHIGFDSTSFAGISNATDFTITLITDPDGVPLAFEYSIPEDPNSKLASGSRLVRRSNVLGISQRYFGDTNTYPRVPTITADGRKCENLRHMWCDWMKHSTALELTTLNIDNLEKEMREWREKQSQHQPAP